MIEGTAHLHPLLRAGWVYTNHIFLSDILMQVVIFSPWEWVPSQNYLRLSCTVTTLLTLHRQQMSKNYISDPEILMNLLFLHLADVLKFMEDCK